MDIIFFSSCFFFLLLFQEAGAKALQKGKQTISRTRVSNKNVESKSQLSLHHYIYEDSYGKPEFKAFLSLLLNGMIRPNITALSRKDHLPSLEIKLATRLDKNDGLMICLFVFLLVSHVIC